jgi:hypothetical protein
MLSNLNEGRSTPSATHDQLFAIRPHQVAGDQVIALNAVITNACEVKLEIFFFMIRP